MKTDFILNLIFVCFIFDETLCTHWTYTGNLTCGLDYSRSSVVYEGVADIESYPWIGMLYYPIGQSRMTTAVVLVTKQMVIGSANEIDKLPKEDVRSRSRVVLGQKCGGPSIRVRDYTFHPDYRAGINSPSALAMVQLEVDHLLQDLAPICAPPMYLIDPEFFAITFNDCNSGKVRIYKMRYVPNKNCKQFYRKRGVEVDLEWPTHTVCARAQVGGRCLWRGGTALVIKQDGQWRLLGFGVHGPGCGAPARFLDYGMQEPWVRKSIARIGMPAITRLADNHLVMRRSLANVQRFGPCDDEEIKAVIYTDLISIQGRKPYAMAVYNLTLATDVEYSCVILHARKQSSSEEASHELLGASKPKLFLRRWCAGPPAVCYGFQYLEIQFYVEILFNFNTEFRIAAYGKSAKIIDPELAMRYANKVERKPEVLKTNYTDLLEKLKANKGDPSNVWFP